MQPLFLRAFGAAGLAALLLAGPAIAQTPTQTPTPTPTPTPTSPKAETGLRRLAPMLVFSIDVRWLGASPYRIERDITSRIEQAVKTLPGVKSVHSTVLGSRAQTQVGFDASADASQIAGSLRSRLDQIKTKLPRDATKPLISWQREPSTP